MPRKSEFDTRRLNRILSDFLHLARPQEPRRAPGDIREVVQHVGMLIRDARSRAPRIDVRVAVDPDVPHFAFDRDQVIQVLWNVALNSVEAMNGRGRLSLDLQRAYEQTHHRWRALRHHRALHTANAPRPRHELGVARMGNSPKTSALNGFCQAHEVKNLFVTDAASFVTNPDKNPTLTIMALATRTADHIADRLKTGEV